MQDKSTNIFRWGNRLLLALTSENTPLIWWAAPQNEWDANIVHYDRDCILINYILDSLITAIQLITVQQ